MLIGTSVGLALLALCWTGFEMGRAAVNQAVQRPYMDEIFHVDQAMRYCRGDFDSWNDKLTTPPGLYLSSIVDSRMIGCPDCCLSVSWLRSVNFGFSIGIALVSALILRSLHHASFKLRTLLSAVNVSLLPVLYFFNYLYYTDVGSTFFVLAAYMLGLRRFYLASALCCFASLWFRQTNIVWTLFICANSAIDVLNVDPKSTTIASLILDALRNVPLLLKRLFAYIAVMCFFGAFVVINGGVVLGDKSNHVAGKHFPQMFYFCSFSCIILSPVLLPHMLKTLKTIPSLISDNIAWLAVATPLGYYAVHGYTYEHPFLLSDNRHYTFYLWKNLYRQFPLARYLLLPIYALAFNAINNGALSTKDQFWKLTFWTCTALALVPSPLLEFRYFIIPCLMIRLNMKMPSVTFCLLETVVLAGVNYLTLWVFVNRPFGVDDQERFMW